MRREIEAVGASLSSIEHGDRALSALTSETDRQRWLGRLAALWPDVGAGDRLTFYVDSAGVGHFWWQDKPLGSLADPQFSAAFLAIWLADNSRDPALTRRLRGQP